MRQPKTKVFLLLYLCVINMSFSTSFYRNDLKKIKHFENVDCKSKNLVTKTNVDTEKQIYESSYKANENFIFTFTDGSWSPQSPIGVSTVLDHIVINSGSAAISSDLIFNSLTINAGASITFSGSSIITGTSITVNGNASLTIADGVILTATDINLNSTSTTYSSLINDGTIIAAVSYHRNTAQIAPFGTNDLISAPLDGQSFSAFNLSNSNLAASGNVRAFAPYNPATGSYNNYNVVLNALTVVDVGKGYRAATTDGGNLTFTGNVRSNDVLNIPITSSGNGWNLIGNPYPSYISFEAFFNENKDQFDSASYQAIYGYDGNASDGWTIWNQATIDSPLVTELIAPGQGFFVKAKTGGGLVDFTKGMRTSGTSDDFILGRSSTSSSHYAYLKLHLRNSNNSNYYTELFLNNNCSDGFDPGYDAVVYGGSVPAFSIYSKLVDDSITNMSLAVQALNPANMYNVMIPLGINANQGEQITISIAQTDIDDGIEIYIDDVVDNTSTLITSTDFVLTPNSDLSGTNRFYLRFGNSTLSTVDKDSEEINIRANNKEKIIVVSGQLQHHTIAKIYNVNGRLIKSTTLESKNNRQNIDISPLSPGLYVIELSDSFNDKITQKLIIQ